MSEIKEEYNELCKKHKLPDFDRLDNEVEISSLEGVEFLLRKVRRRMNEKIVFFCRVIEGFLFPNGQSLVNMQESKFFNDKEKEEIMVLYKRLMVYERRALELDIKPNNKEEVVLINDIFSNWNTITKKMAEVSVKMKEGWDEEVSKGKNEGYFG